MLGPWLEYELPGIGATVPWGTGTAPYDVATVLVGACREARVKAGDQSSRFFVVSPLALSHSSGAILFSVTPKVQMWPSGSRAR